MSKLAQKLHPLKSPLAQRLIFAIALFSVALTLVMTVAQHYRQDQRDRAAIEAQLTQIGEVHLRTLSQMLWATNQRELQSQIEGMLKLPNIVYAAIHEGGRTQIELGQRPAGRSIERRYVLRLEQPGKTREIGVLTVVADPDILYRQRLQEAGGVLLDNALLTLLVALFIFVLFQRLVTRHLGAVARHLRDLDPHAAQAPLILDRTKPAAPDELDALVMAANDMQRNVRVALDALRDSEARVRLLLDSTSEAIYGLDVDGVCTFVNPACVRALGYANENDLVGKRIHELIHHSHADGRHYPLDDCAVRVATLAGQPSHRDDEVHWRADGSSFPVEYWSHPMFKDGELVGAVVVFMDISVHKQTEAELHRLAYYDNLTALPNRLLFNDRLRQAIADAKRRHTHVALMLLDIDRFKVVNDTLGHEAGDQLLREIAVRLKRSIRESDTVARLGGDEFALVFADLAEAQRAAQLAENVLAQFAAPLSIGGRELFSGASIGVALYPADSEDQDSLLKFADSAMYHAKESGRNNYQFYSHDMTASIQARLRLETDLRRALEKNELFLHYQPQVDTASNRITGVEALLRWRDASGAFISPVQFIPLAEETGLIVPIGQWVLETACKQLKYWHERGHEDLTMAVNVAPRQFRDPLFGATVSQAIAAAKLRPNAIELEITESILLENSDHIRQILEQIKAQGVVLAIDDFGTGYSSLSYLKRFPIDRLKIDQSFVRDLGVDNDDLAIVKAIIALARSLKLRVVAEGVETAAQLALLRSEGCEEYQGYFFARPMDADSLSALLQKLTLPA